MNENYILMCKEAKEIQEGWEPKEYDQVLNLTAERNGLHKTECLDPELFICPDENFKKWAVWLPRQEDLQKIHMEHVDFPVQTATFESFMNWLFDFGCYPDFGNGGDKFNYFYKGHGEINTSIMGLNELWLCFVMETCYNKTWNGSAWEVVKDE